MMAAEDTVLQQSPCLCASLRKASRVITKKYDQHLRPADLRITQYSMLANILRNPGVTISNLSKILIMDQTTVTRNLQVLQKADYVHIELENADQRTKKVFISEKGKRKFEAARPLWQAAQVEIEKTLGKLGMDLLLQSLSAVTK